MSNKDLHGYVSTHKLDFPIYSDIDSGTKSIYKFSGTPQTLVISKEGKVLKVWNGAFMNDLQKEIEGYFHLSLPGLENISNSTAIISN